MLRDILILSVRSLKTIVHFQEKSQKNYQWILIERIKQGREIANDRRDKRDKKERLFPTAKAIIYKQ